MTGNMTPDTETTTLANLDGILGEIAGPDEHVEYIGFVLDALHDDGADPVALEDIQTSVGAIVTSLQQYAQVADALKALAFEVREQRDAVRQEFDELREAVETFDQSHPAVESLYEYVEELSFEFLQMAFYEDFSNVVFDITPLEHYEIATLINLLTDRDETVPQDDPLWDEFRAWLDRAEAAAVRLDGHAEEAAP